MYPVLKNVTMRDNDQNANIQSLSTSTMKDFRDVLVTLNLIEWQPVPSMTSNLVTLLRSKNYYPYQVLDIEQRIIDFLAEPYYYNPPADPELMKDYNAPVYYSLLAIIDNLQNIIAQIDT
jgi:hypothetical protein